MGFSEIKNLIKSEQDRWSGRFIEHLSVEEYLCKIKDSAEFIAHYSGAECVGFIAFYCNDPDKKLAFITLVLISPEYRGKGIAKALIEYVIFVLKSRGFKSCKLELEADNISALGLYQRSGFEIVSEHEDNIVMEKCF